MPSYPPAGKGIARPAAPAPLQSCSAWLGNAWSRVGKSLLQQRVHSHAADRRRCFRGPSARLQCRPALAVASRERPKAERSPLHSPPAGPAALPAST